MPNVIAQAREFVGQVIRQLPDLDPVSMQRWIDDPQGLHKALQEALGSAFPDSVREVVKNVPVHDGGIILDEFLKTNERFIDGEEMLVRAETGPNLGYQDALRYQDDPSLLPKEAKGRTLVFAGTVVVNEYRERNVPGLDHVGGRLSLDWYWLGEGFGSRFCLARPTSST